MLIPVITIVSGTVNVILNLLWIPDYGLAGAAWAPALHPFGAALDALAATHHEQLLKGDEA